MITYIMVNAKFFLQPLQMTLAEKFQELQGSEDAGNIDPTYEEVDEIAGLDRLDAMI
jgi:hypothetical protein